MKADTKKVKVIDLKKNNVPHYPNQYTSCLILTYDNRFLLQKRGKNWSRYPGYIATFGGKIEKGETRDQGIIRELKEELGADVKAQDLIYFGAVTESLSHYTELVHQYFWHDKENTITGCYEGETVYFKKIDDILKVSKLMDDVSWVVEECKKRGFPVKGLQ